MSLQSAQFRFSCSRTDVDTVGLGPDERVRDRVGASRDPELGIVTAAGASRRTPPAGALGPPEPTTVAEPQPVEATARAVTRSIRRRGDEARPRGGVRRDVEGRRVTPSGCAVALQRRVTPAAGRVLVAAGVPSGLRGDRRSVVTPFREPTRSRRSRSWSRDGGGRGWQAWPGARPEHRTMSPASPRSGAAAVAAPTVSSRSWRSAQRRGHPARDSEQSRGLLYSPVPSAVTVGGSAWSGSSVSAFGAAVSTDRHGVRGIGPAAGRQPARPCSGPRHGNAVGGGPREAAGDAGAATCESDGRGVATAAASAGVARAGGRCEHGQPVGRRPDAGRVELDRRRRSTEGASQPFWLGSAEIIGTTAP